MNFLANPIEIWKNKLANLVSGSTLGALRGAPCCVAAPEGVCYLIAHRATSSAHRGRASYPWLSSVALPLFSCESLGHERS